MKRLLTLTAFGLFALTGLQAQTGQQGQQGQQQIEEAEIVIRKDRKIVLPPATRNFEKIPQLPKSTGESSQRFEFKRYNFELDPFMPTFQAVQYAGETGFKELKSNYIKAGFGNYVTPYVEAYIGSKRRRNYLYNFYIRHYSSQKGPVADENSGNGSTEAAVSAKFYDGTNTISGSLLYQRRNVHFYGYNPVLDYNPEDIEQIFNKFSAILDVRRTVSHNKYDYHFKTDWGFMKDLFESRESKFFFDTGFEYNFTEEFKFDVDLLGTLSKRKQVDETDFSRNYVNIMPRLVYTTDAIGLEAGFNIAGDNDDTGEGVKLYPAVKASYKVNSGLLAYVGYEGSVEMNTMESILKENPFMMSDFELRNTEKKSDIFGGIEMDLTERLQLKSGFSIAALNNMPFLTNAQTDSTKFETLFDGGTTDRLNVFGAINFENPGMVRSSLRFDFFNYSLATLAEAWHKPDYKVAFNNSFFPVEKLVVTADLYYLGGLNALNGETDEAYNLDDIFDLNLGARYDISQRFGVFLQFNNLFGKEYQRYLNYPTRGIQVLGGLSVSF